MTLKMKGYELTLFITLQRGWAIAYLLHTSFNKSALRQVVLGVNESFMQSADTTTPTL